MAKYVRATLEVDTEIKNTGVTFAVHEGDQLLGYLEVSKAKLKWTDKHGKKPDGEATWEQFIAWMKE